MKAFIRKNAVPLVTTMSGTILVLFIYIIWPVFNSQLGFRKLAIENAAPRIFHYQQYAHQLKTFCKDGETLAPLRSFIIPVDALKKSIVKDRIFWFSKNIHENVLIMPLVAHGYNVTKPKAAISFAIIGVDRNGNIDTSAMYNYCDPCPNKCDAQNTGLTLNWAKFEQEIKDAHPDFKDFSFAETCN